jgi:hypothetical protein
LTMRGPGARGPRGAARAPSGGSTFAYNGGSAKYWGVADWFLEGTWPSGSQGGLGWGVWDRLGGPSGS